MIYHNERVIKDFNIQLLKKYGKGFIEYLDSLESRIAELEKKKVGRPRKIDGTND